MIGIPTKGEMKTRTVDNVIAAFQHANSNGIKTKVVFAEGTVVPLVRTALLNEFKKFPTFTHLLFIDSDQTFKPDFITKLVKYDKDVVAAISKVRSGESWNAYEFDNASKLYKAIQINEIGLQQVDAVGMGMMLIKRKVAACINKIECSGEKSEDIYFCERARELNFEVYIDSMLRLGHLVTVELK